MCQQLSAIQRELEALTRPNNTSGPSTSFVGGTTGSSELDNDEQKEADDVAGLKRRIEAMEAGSEELTIKVRGDWVG